MLDVLVPREFVESSDDQMIFQEPVSGTRCLEFVVCEDLKGKLKTTVEFVLPLLSQASRTDNEAALQISPHNQFFDQ